MSAVLRIIRPSSREQTDLLPARIAELTGLGFTVRHDELRPDPSWTYAAASPRDRAWALETALTEPGTDFVLAARGGYGASDLLPLLDWERLGRAAERTLIGFSDVSTLHCALYARLGWRGLHGPMPATALWRRDGDGDVDQLLGHLLDLKSARPVQGGVDLVPLSPTSPPGGPALEGRLFGGCFTVLTSLIGTPYFPKTLAGHILFIEDIDESPARLMRALNQWLQAGVFKGVVALVVGYLKGLGEKIPDCAPFVLEQFARRLGPIPVYHSTLFGHTSPNFPLPIGSQATIADGRLNWLWQPSHREILT